MVEESARVERKASSSSWVVEMEQMLHDTSPSVEKEQWKKTTIYRVPKWHKELTNSKAYQPLLVSLGPFHHGEPDLLPMEEHKRRAVMHLVKRAERPLGEFVAAIEEVADNLQDAYQGLDDKWRGEHRGRFVKLMVTDGCFLLEIMRADMLTMQDEGDDDYAANDPVFSKHGLIFLFGAIRVDMVVIENQLPLLVLERLVALQNGRPPSSLEINKMVCLFLGRPYFQGMDMVGLHPLDIFHESFCGGRQHNEESDAQDVIIPNARELSEAGIHFKKSDTPWVHDVDLENNGVLSIPPVTVDESTEKEFLNLIIFEQLHADAGSDVTNYLLFMDHIIDSERDVALLRSNGMIQNFCSDKEVANMFNKLCNGATPNTTIKLQEVKDKIKAHCAKRRNKWRAFFVQAYLSNPWVFISLVAAVILLVATLLQTIYTVVPFYTKN